MASPLEPDARHIADENRIKYGRTGVSLFRIYRTISALTVSIPVTAPVGYHVQPLRCPIQEGFFLEAVKLTRTGATAAVKLVWMGRRPIHHLCRWQICSSQ